MRFAMPGKPIIPALNRYRVGGIGTGFEARVKDSGSKASSVESGMHAKWTGKKMRAFGPAKNLFVQHLATLKEFPPRGAALSSEAEIEQPATGGDGLTQ